MSNPDLNCFVNLEAYPIDRLDSEAGQELLNRAHRMMKEDTLVEFPDFLRSQAVVALAEELTGLESNAHQIDYMSTPYGWMDNSEFPPNHPRSALFDATAALSRPSCLLRAHCRIGSFTLMN